MSEAQAGILEPIPAVGRYLAFGLQTPQALPDALRALQQRADGRQLVVGLGASLVHALGRELPGLRTYAASAPAGLDLPATPHALWCWLRGTQRGDLLQLSRELELSLLPAFRLQHVADAFKHRGGLDLSGYEDGTENPTGDAALDAALASGQGAGLDGASYVAVQQWLHDFPAFDAMSPPEQDNAIGRRRSDNEELEDAPESSHVKRTAQESFDPEAFLLRRSMPWAEGQRCGLMFVAFGRSFDAFEAQWRRMTGVEDGVLDALFRFTRPLGGAYYWCPPMLDGRADLRALGL